MATYTIDSYQRLWRRRAVALRKMGIKTSRDAAYFAQATAKGMAPKKTGELRAGINVKQTSKNSYQVNSSVPGKFPYHFWVNQTAPFRTIRPWWNKGEPTIYGDGSHHITGTPRYWHLTTLRTKNKFSSLARENLKKVLRLGV